MKVLIVCRKKNDVSPFISEQVESIREHGIEVNYFFIQGNGIKAYLKEYPLFKKEISAFKPDLIHAHYGLSGIFANLQRSIPVITTFHGTDLHSRKVRFLSQFAATLSKHAIYVSEQLSRNARVKNNFSIIPCGINFKTFYPVNTNKARELMGLDLNKKYVLFSGSFDVPIKNANLARSAIKKFDEDVHLIELKSYSREEVNLLFNACNVALMTSKREGSPQFIKEALACNCPIVSTPVGDVPKLLNNIEGCYLSSFDPDDIYNKLKKAILFGRLHNSAKKISHLNNIHIANRIILLYNTLV